MQRETRQAASIFMVQLVACLVYCGVLSCTVGGVLLCVARLLRPTKPKPPYTYGKLSTDHALSHPCSGVLGPTHTCTHSANSMSSSRMHMLQR